MVAVESLYPLPVEYGLHGSDATKLFANLFKKRRFEDSCAGGRLKRIFGEDIPAPEDDFRPRMVALLLASFDLPALLVYTR